MPLVWPRRLCDPGSVRYLYLLRHAKSSWDDPHLPDHDRPLAPRGLRDARRMADYVHEHGIALTLVVCSSSRRTRETLKPMKKALAGSQVLIEEDLYAADEFHLLERVRRIPDRVSSAMLVGHDPGIKLLCLYLAGASASELLTRIEAKFPTGALATLAIPEGSWRAIDAGDATLIGFVTPKELRESR
jgi:phosphohistidine phosphatase